MVPWNADSGATNAVLSPANQAARREVRDLALLLDPKSLDGRKKADS